MCSQSLLTFELFSVMVHSGSAAGGHYYACIKSFSDGQWYSFNDQHVSKVSLEQRSCRMTHYTVSLLIINEIVLCLCCARVLSLCLCAFLLARSPKKISGRHMVGPQGAEAITPVPLQGQLCLTSACNTWCVVIHQVLGSFEAQCCKNFPVICLAPCDQVQDQP